MAPKYDQKDREFIHKNLKRLKKEFRFQWVSTAREKVTDDISLVDYIKQKTGTYFNYNSISEFDRFKNLRPSIVTTVVEYMCVCDPNFRQELAAFHNRPKEREKSDESAALPEGETQSVEQTAECIELPEGELQAVEQTTAKRSPTVKFIAILGTLTAAAGALALALFWNKQEAEILSPRGESTPQHANLNAPKISKLGSQNALAKLSKRGVPVTFESLNSAVSVADTELLELLHAAGMNSAVIRKAFSSKKTILGFFENSNGNRKALLWFKNVALKALDIHKLIDTGGDKSSLILHAIQSSNIEAVKILLETGASAHAYRSLFLSPFTLTSFVHPYSYVLRNSDIPTDVKKELFKLFAQHGAVHIKPGDEVKSEMFALDRQSAALKKDYRAIRTGFGLTPPMQESVCAQNKKRWCGGKGGKRNPACKIANAAPKSFRIEDRNFRLLANVDVMNFIGMYQDKGYFIARLPLGYGLLEMRSDLLQMSVYGVISPAAGMGHCKPFDNDPSSVPKRCWRRIVIDSIAQNERIETMSLNNFYKFKIEHCKAAG